MASSSVDAEVPEQKEVSGLDAENDRLTKPLDQRLKNILHSEEGEDAMESPELLQFEIDTLTGKGWSTESVEVKAFKQYMSRLRQVREDKLKSQPDREFVGPPVYLCSEPIPPTMPTKFICKITLPQEEMSKKALFNGNDTVAQAIETIIEKMKRASNITKEADQFVFKVSGMAEYLYGNHSLLSFDYIRNCLKKNKDIELNIVEKSSLPTTISAADLAIIYSEDLSIDEENEDHSVISVENRSFSSSARLSLWDMTRNFRVRVVGADNVVLSEGVEADPDDLVIFVLAELYHGDQPLLEKPLYSRALTFSRSARWSEWLEADSFFFSQMPKASRLCFTLFARPYNKDDPLVSGSQAAQPSLSPKDIPIGWASLQMVDFKGELHAGVRTLRLWPDERANPIGTNVDNLASEMPSQLTIEFDTYAYPVVFPVGNPPSVLPSFAYKPNPIVAKIDAGSYSEYHSEIEKIVRQDPLYELTFEDKTILWRFREEIKMNPLALPKFLFAVDWKNPEDVVEAHRLLKEWSPIEPLAALELLDAKHADARVREYAVSRLDGLQDPELMDFILQLSQVLKYETAHNSALARWLLRRAARSPHLIGHVFYWHLKAEMHVPSIRERYGLLLEEYVLMIGPHHRRELLRQNTVEQQLLAVALEIKRTPKATQLQTLHELLAKVELPAKFKLPLSPRLEASGLLIEKCKVMDSKKLPIWLVFKNADPTGDPIRVIFKAGDDLRQDQLTLQMLRIMDKLWKMQGLDLRLIPYACIATGDGVGMIEVVLDSDTIAHITHGDGGAMKAFSDEPLAKWLKAKNPSDELYAKAQRNFSLSCAGYCVATYVLGIGDRHNDNIMLTTNGNLFHIDFGHFLGNFKKFAGFNRETAPFRFTPMYAAVLGGRGTPLFDSYVEIGRSAYNAIRRNGPVFMNLFQLMLSTGIPELRSVDDIKYLRNCLQLDLSEEKAADHFQKLVDSALDNKRARLDDAIHIFVHA